MMQKKDQTEQPSPEALDIVRRMTAEAQVRLAAGKRLNPVQQRLILGQELTASMLELLVLQQGDQTPYPLTQETEKSIQHVKALAQTLYGETWNFLIMTDSVVAVKANRIDRAH